MNHIQSYQRRACKAAQARQSGGKSQEPRRTAARCIPRARLRPALGQVHAARSCVACGRAAPAVSQKNSPVRPAGAPSRQRWRWMMALRPMRRPRLRQTLTARANADAPGLYRYRWWLHLYSIRCLAWLAPEIGPRSTRRRRPGTGFRAAHRAAARLAPAGFNPSRYAALASAVLDTHTPTK